MKVNLRFKILLFSIIILAGNGILGYAIYKGNQKLLSSERWIEHTQQVIYQSIKIFSEGSDIETASNSFVITNDSAFLQPLYNAQKITFAYIGQFIAP